MAMTSVWLDFKGIVYMVWKKLILSSFIRTQSLTGADWLKCQTRKAVLLEQRPVNVVFNGTLRLFTLVNWHPTTVHLTCAGLLFLLFCMYIERCPSKQMQEDYAYKKAVFCLSPWICIMYFLDREMWVLDSLVSTTVAIISCYLSWTGKCYQYF